MTVEVTITRETLPSVDTWQAVLRLYDGDRLVGMIYRVGFSSLEAAGEWAEMEAEKYGK